MNDKINILEWVNFIEMHKEDILSFDYSNLNKDMPENILRGTMNLKYNSEMLSKGLYDLSVFKNNILSSPQNYEFINNRISKDNINKIIYIQIENILDQNKLHMKIPVDLWKLLIIAHDYIINNYYIAKERKCLELLIDQNPLMSKEAIIALYSDIKNDCKSLNKLDDLENIIKNHDY